MPQNDFSTFNWVVGVATTALSGWAIWVTKLVNNLKAIDKTVVNLSVDLDNNTKKIDLHRSKIGKLRGDHDRLSDKQDSDQKHQASLNKIQFEAIIDDLKNIRILLEKK